MTTPDIEHIVVLMLENRSFDHMLGTLPGVDGVLDASGALRSELVNYVDPTDTSSTAYHPKIGAKFFTPTDQQTNSGEYGGPSHSYPSASEQRFGAETDTSGTTAPYYGPTAKTFPADQPVGFAMSFTSELTRDFQSNGTTLAAEQAAAAASGGEDPVQEVMEIFTADQLPAIHSLAKEYCVCDRWFSEVPGPTEPNRLFTHAATSTGLTYNPWKYDPITAPTIYERLDAAGKSWGMYGFDLFDCANFSALADRAEGKQTLSDFSAAATAGTLPFYSFICPRYSDATEGQANSQHAPHDVRYGDALIAEIYQLVRSSPGWEKTLLVVTYDEHGGYYDHVVPPAVSPPDADVSPNLFMQKEASDDGKTYLTDPDYTFRFDALGFRVPAVLVSPLIPKGTVDSRDLRHTSILRFIADLIGSEPLTRRDETASSLAPMLSLSSPRTDCPATVPAPVLPATDPELTLSSPPGVMQEGAARRHTTPLKGHPDTGTRTSRTFTTRKALSSYIAQRNQRDAWHRSGSHAGARFEIYADKNGRWRWRLREGSDDIIALSSDSYDSQHDAEVALERTRYLSHVLTDPVVLN